MKRFCKTLMVAAVVAILGTGTVFAKGKNGPDGKMGKGMGGRYSIAADGTVTQAKDLIGQVTAVDEKNGTIKISDADGKEITITISPFTSIRKDDSKDEKTIADIKKGDWIMYALYNTETEKKLASRIYVKSNQ